MRASKLTEGLLIFWETGFGDSPYPQIRPRATLAHRLVEIHVYRVDDFGELITLCSATLADLVHAYSSI